MVGGMTPSFAENSIEASYHVLDSLQPLQQLLSENIRHMPKIQQKYAIATQVISFVSKICVPLIQGEQSHQS